MRISPVWFQGYSMRDRCVGKEGGPSSVSSVAELNRADNWVDVSLFEPIIPLVLSKMSPGLTILLAQGLPVL